MNAEVWFPNIMFFLGAGIGAWIIWNFFYKFQKMKYEDMKWIAYQWECKYNELLKYVGVEDYKKRKIL